ncbi:hypothetical protein PRN20_09870 [Devosia sp. ZB163]|uniref:hypothetical protein n=1 Tax=Devosia sp. ZB163 TaxID=3025938 RepID=UPI00235E64A6|nr:hypothetical protein [Devosia sp. ZB163]MDC9824043.1 hypothetical protein [Devosia sp. ZB163]
MSGAFAIVAALFAFAIPIAVPLFVQRWQSFGVVVVAGILFFAWVTHDLANPAGMTQVLGSFLFGLMLFGFAAGVIAKFVMLLSRR